MSNIDKIRQEIERRIHICDGVFERNSDTYYQGKAVAYQETLSFIDSLQQEQPAEKTCKDCGFYENNCPYIRGKFIPYPSKVCKDYTYSAIKEQEQPSEDLLRPSWKPSEEQMEALEYVIRDYREDSCNATANYLQEILDHLKNM